MLPAFQVPRDPGVNGGLDVRLQTSGQIQHRVIADACRRDESHHRRGLRFGQVARVRILRPAGADAIGDNRDGEKREAPADQGKPARNGLGWDLDQAETWAAPKLDLGCGCGPRRR